MTFKKRTKLRILTIPFISFIIFPLCFIVSCSKGDINNMTVSQLVDYYYPPNKFQIKLNVLGQNIEAKDFTNDESLFLVKPENKPNLKCEFIPGKNQYFSSKGEVIVTYKFTKISTNEQIEKTFLVKGFKKSSFQDYIDEIYGDIKIQPTIVAKEYTASQDIWSPLLITDEYFEGLPKSKDDGIKVEVESVIANEEECYIDIYYKFSSDDEYVRKVYRVEGFKEAASFDEIINENYGEIQITPTKKALEIPLTIENWPVEKITSEYFNGLPVSKNGIDVSVIETKIDDDYLLSNILFITFKFKKEAKSTYRTIGVKFNKSFLF